MQGVVNSIHAVDTFFILSGVLLSYNLLRELDRRKGCFNLPLLYLHRYLRYVLYVRTTGLHIVNLSSLFNIFLLYIFIINRLTPVYATIIAFTATMLIYVGTGPHWKVMVGNMRESCRHNWWINLLYVNNHIGLSTAVINYSIFLNIILIYSKNVHLVRFLHNNK